VISALNPRERVLTTLEHEEPDRVPLTDHIYMPKSLEGILGEPGVRVDTPEKYIKVHKILGLDIICAFPAASPMTQLGEREYVDVWGIRWRVVDGMPWYVEGTLKDAEDIERLAIPDPHEEFWYKAAERIIKLVGGELAIAGIVEGPFTRTWMPLGFTRFSKMLYTEPSTIRKLIDKVTYFFIELGKNFIERGVDIIWIPDDLGYVNGPMLSPALLRRFFFPRLKEMVHTFKRRGVKVLLHSDGQLMPIMEDIVNTGLDGIHPIERAAGMSLKVMKERYGDQLTLIGNVGAKTVLQNGPLESIKEQVLECISIAAPGGGYILASDHSIHEGIPPAHVKYMFKVAKQYGRYPLRIPTA